MVGTYCSLTSLETDTININSDNLYYWLSVHCSKTDDLLRDYPV